MVYYVAVAVGTRSRCRLMRPIAERSYLAAMQALQNDLAQTAISKLVETKRKYKILSAPCPELELTCFVLL